jgi:AcrR family transcriptional regulator
MARRNDHSREQLMRLVVDAAGALVDEGGARNVTARAVAARVGHTAGTLYTHFVNLDDVLLHVNLRSLKGIRLAWGELAARGLEPTATIEAMAGAWLAFARDRPRRFELLIEGVLPGSGPAPPWVRQNVGQLHALLRVQLGRLGVSDADLDRRAGALFAAVHGVAMLALGGRLLTADWQSDEATLDFVVRGCLGG